MLLSHNIQDNCFDISYMLEAMSYNIDTLVSDIPANLAVGLSKEHYYISFLVYCQ